MKEYNDKEDKLLVDDCCQKEINNDKFDGVILLSDMNVLKDEYMN